MIEKMSIASQISRIQGLVSELRTNIINKGVQLAADADLEDCVDAVPNISGGPTGYAAECLTIENTGSNNAAVRIIRSSDSNYNDSTKPAVDSTQTDTYTFEWSRYRNGQWSEWTKQTMTWTSITSANRNMAIGLNVGEKLRFRSNDRRIRNSVTATSTSTSSSVTRSYERYYYHIECYLTGSSTTFSAYGNPLSMVYGTEYLAQTGCPAEGLANLFFHNSYLTDVTNLVMPLSLGYASCKEMFYGCTSLTTAPELPATRLGNDCYRSMFNGCTSLTTAPTLPATTLVEGCYYVMFRNCTSLTSAPTLPATTLAENCYNSMFSGCTSLTSAPELPATTLANRCYDSMFYGCTSLITAPSILPATTLVGSCYQNMFNGCTGLTTAPELPATTLATYCYQQMFYECSNLNYVKAMFTTIPGFLYTSNWLSGVSSTGTFVKNSAATWTTTGVNAVPTGWTIETASS